MKVAIYLALFVHAVNADMAGECNMAGFYLELGCAPAQPADNSSACPRAFSCPDLHPDPSYCYFRGKPYKNGDTVPETLTNNPCSQACTCLSGGAEPSFQCAAVDCVETFDADLQKQCIYTYDLDACCFTGSVCGKDAIAKLKTCEVDEKTYKEGQIFQPKNTRKTCICTAQFNGTFENGNYCRDINCGIEIHYQEKLLESCAPIFVSDARNCPIAFECLTNTTKITRNEKPSSPELQCQFGNMTLGLGDEVSSEEKCTRCLCEVPPFVSCMKTTSCD